MATPATTPSAEPVEAATSTPIPAAEPAETVPVEVAPSISTVLSDPPEAGGWRVPAGTWATMAFDTPAQFTTTSEMLLVRESEGALWLRPVGAASTSVLAIGTAAFVNSGGRDAPQLPPPRSPEAITEAFENGTFSVLLDHGLTSIGQRNLNWWDFLLDDTVGNAPWLCREGVTCLMTSQSVGGERVIVPTGTPLRLYTPDIDDLRVGAWLIADSEVDLAPLTALAEDVLADLRLAPGPPAVAPIRSMTVDGVQTTESPAGHTVGLLGDAAVELELQGTLPDIGLDAADETALIFSTPSGYIAMFAASGLYSADIDVQATEQADWRAWDLVDLADLEAFETWADASLEVTERGVDDRIAGLEAPWIDFTVKDQVNSFPCTISAGKQCSMLTTFAGGGWAYAEGEGNRLYFLDEAGLIVNVEALTGTPTDVLEEAEALLGGLTITPIG